MKKISITVNDVVFEAALNGTATARQLREVLPLKASAARWGDEIYCTVPLSVQLENPAETVHIGDIAYWPPGNALCVFFGKTPISTAAEIRPASAVTVIGHLISSPDMIADITGELIIHIDCI